MVFSCSHAVMQSYSNTVQGNKEDTTQACSAMQQLPIGSDERSVCSVLDAAQKLCCTRYSSVQFCVVKSQTEPNTNRQTEIKVPQN